VVVVVGMAVVMRVLAQGCHRRGASFIKLERHVDHRERIVHQT